MALNLCATSLTAAWSALESMLMKSAIRMKLRSFAVKPSWLAASPIRLRLSTTLSVRMPIAAPISDFVSSIPVKFVSLAKLISAGSIASIWFISTRKTADESNPSARRALISSTFGSPSFRSWVNPVILSIPPTIAVSSPPSISRSLAMNSPGSIPVFRRSWRVPTPTARRALASSNWAPPSPSPSTATTS